jgi:hypothetical protein
MVAAPDAATGAMLAPALANGHRDLNPGLLQPREKTGPRKRRCSAGTGTKGSLNRLLTSSRGSRSRFSRLLGRSRRSRRSGGRGCRRFSGFFRSGRGCRSRGGFSGLLSLGSGGGSGFLSRSSRFLSRSRRSGRRFCRFLFAPGQGGGGGGDYKQGIQFHDVFGLVVPVGIWGPEQR